MASLNASNTDGQTQPCWLGDSSSSAKTAAPAACPELATNLRDVDVCVIGAGLAGLSVAYECVTSGLSVVVLEGGASVGSGDTLRTSACLSSALIDCAVIARIHGDAKAHLAVQSHAAAIDRIEAIAKQEGIQCQLERVTGYLMPNFTDEEAAKKAAKEDRRAPKDMLDELVAAKMCGLDVKLIESGPPLNQRGAVAEGSGPGLSFANQAVFNPSLYVNGLAQAVLRHGGRIYCNTRAAEWQGGSAETTRVVTSTGHIVHCRSIVVATNSAEGNTFALNDRVIANRSYACSARVPKGSLPHCCVWSMDRDDKSYAPYSVCITSHPRSSHTENARKPAGEDAPSAEAAAASDANLLSQSEDDCDQIIISGQDHPVGELEGGAAYEERFKRLECWARERWQFGAVDHRWSGQLLMPVDHLAYTGRNVADAENVFVHTGAGATGLTAAVTAGMLLRDLLLKRETQLGDVFSPARLPPRAWIDYAKHVAQSSLHYFRWLKLSALSGDSGSAADLAPGSGAVVHSGGEFVAAYRDGDGSLHRHSGVCPHGGRPHGLVRWNPVEKSFDCALDGSRFDAMGRRINGPAGDDLRPMDQPDRDEQRRMDDRVEKAKAEDDLAAKERHEAHVE